MGVGGVYFHQDTMMMGVTMGHLLPIDEACVYIRNQWSTSTCTCVQIPTSVGQHALKYKRLVSG